MGSEMVNRLLSKGHSVTGYNRTRSKAERLIKKGMKWADSPRAVVESDVIFSMVTNSAALGAIMNGPDGMLSAVTPGKIFVDISTVSPAFSREIANKIREKGGDMVDAPVSGSVITLQQGKLSVMVGGRKETFEKVKPLLLDIGPKVTYVGENGLALVIKIATNLSLAVQMLAFCEGVLLAEKSGITRETAVDVVRRQHDAEGPASGLRTWAATGRAHAHNGHDQRISDRRARHGAGGKRLCSGVRCVGANVRGACMKTLTDPTKTETAAQGGMRWRGVQ
jgi:3-hydroxyisobutyrate dehydrogenase-like beta-hydroxyacid dehydrogenase